MFCPHTPSVTVDPIDCERNPTANIIIFLKKCAPDYYLCMAIEKTTGTGSPVVARYPLIEFDITILCAYSLNVDFIIDVGDEAHEVWVFKILENKF